MRLQQTQFFKYLTSLSRICLLLYLILGYATDDYFLSANTSLWETVFTEVLQVFILFSTQPGTVCRSGCPLYKQFRLHLITHTTHASSNGQWVDLTKYLFRNLLVTSHILACLNFFALKTRNPPTNPEHSRYQLCRQRKQEVLWITKPLKKILSAELPAPKNPVLFSLFT